MIDTSRSWSFGILREGDNLSIIGDKETFVLVETHLYKFFVGELQLADLFEERQRKDF